MRIDFGSCFRLNLRQYCMLCKDVVKNHQNASLRVFFFHRKWKNAKCSFCATSEWWSCIFNAVKGTIARRIAVTSIILFDGCLYMLSNENHRSPHINIHNSLGSHKEAHSVGGWSSVISHWLNRIWSNIQLYCATLVWKVNEQKPLKTFPNTTVKSNDDDNFSEKPEHLRSKALANSNKFFR